MAGTAINPSPASGMDTTTLTPSLVNSYRISAVADRLATHIRNTHQSDIAEFFNLCLDLARGIDYAIANNDVPSRAQDLPLLLKQVCQHKYDSLLQAVIMVLMISVKNACRRRWFTDKDSDELQTLANEIKSSFCIARDINTEASSFLPTVSTIMSRFYPRMKMGQVLAFLEVKSGYGAFVIDFHIPKDAKSSPEDKIRLFVAQTDNIESSSCLISPLHVNFLLNGKGVERRTNVIMDTGPQIPTIVTHMLKYGTNLLQAVGQFNGNYVIVVAFMSMISTPLCPALQDYVQPAVTILDSDSEIIEGPSRISLNCPISFRRIKTPVKGHSCKHLPCFDLENFVDINSRRPSWRCPYCNQYVCFTEIRIDRNMARVLEEAGENVTDVIISADGSWKAVMESDEHTDKLHQKTLQEHTSLSNGPPDTLDLTEDDEMDAIGNENEDTKPFPANFQTQPCVNNLTINPAINNTSAVNQDTASHMEGDFWSGIYLSTFGSGTSGARSNAQIGGILESDPTNLISSPVLTDAISPTLLATSVEQNQVFAPNYMQLQQFGNSNMSNEYGMFPSIPRHVNRTPIAVQALAAQTPAPVPQQRSRTSLNSQTSPTLPLVMDAFNNLSNHVEMQQQFSRSHSNPPQTSHLTASSFKQLMGLQNWDGQGQSFISSQPAQQISGLRAPGHLASAHRVSSSLLTELQNLNPQQPLNPRMPHAMSQSPSLIQSSAQARTQIHQGGTQCGIAQRRSPSMPVPVQTSRASSPFSVNADGSFRAPSGGTTANPNNGLVDSPTEQNWRPAGRMRGALSGQAYSAAFNQYIIQAAQQAAGPLSNMNSPTPNVPSQLHVLAANLRNAHAPQPVNFPSTEPAGMAGGLGFHPR